MDQTLIGLDAGTTGVTAILFDEDLLPLARAYREFPQHFPQPGWVEHDGRDITDAVDTVLGEILADPRAGDVAAIGVTNQRETVFACDRTSGRALARGIVWQDRRTADRCDELRAMGLADEVRARTGLVLDPYFSGTKIEWLLREVPGIADAAQAGEVVFATVDAFVVRHLSADGVWSTDPTNASRTMLFDIDTARYDEGLCARLGIRPQWLPEVLPSAAKRTETDPARTSGRAIAVHAAIGDQQSALCGQGCFEAGTFKATYGTGSFLVLNTGAERVDSTAGLLTTLAADAEGATCYAIEGSVFLSGALVQWLRDQLGFFERSAEVEALARQVDDAGGVVFVPAFAGLGAPYWDADARGAILGLTRGTTRAHIARAALEAIAFQNAELIELLRKETGLGIEALLADGGAAQNDLLMQLQADLAGLDVLRPASVEATARGAALLAGVSCGLVGDARSCAGLRQERDRFAPQTSDEHRAARLSAWRGGVQRVLSR